MVVCAVKSRPCRSIGPQSRTSLWGFAGFRTAPGDSTDPVAVPVAQPSCGSTADTSTAPMPSRRPPSRADRGKHRALPAPGSIGAADLLVADGDLVQPDMETLRMVAVGVVRELAEGELHVLRRRPLHVLGDGLPR